MPLLCEIPKDYSLVNQGISQSIMSSFGCRQKLMLTLNRYAGQPNLNTFYGTAFHDLFEGVYRNLKTFSFPKSLKLYNKFLMESQKKSMKDKNQIAIEKISADYKLQSIVFPEYFSFYEKVDRTREWVHLEKEFNYIWLKKYRLRGKIDGIYKDKKGKYWIAEHKTKSQINEEILQKVLTLNFQNLFYIKAVEDTLNIKISGVLYDIIRKPQQRIKKDENEKEFADRLREEISSNKKHFFIRMELAYSPAEKKLFEQELQYKLEEVEMVLSGKLPIYRNECLCEKPFPCNFLDACSSGKLELLRRKETLFEELEEE